MHEIFDMKSEQIVRSRVAGCERRSADASDLSKDLRSEKYFSVSFDLIYYSRNVSS